LSDERPASPCTYSARNFVGWCVQRGYARDIAIPIYERENLRSEFIEADERWSQSERDGQWLIMFVGSSTARRQKSALGDPSCDR
jgi:hypothetical protein